jgi:hypothetical protein
MKIRLWPLFVGILSIGGLTVGLPCFMRAGQLVPASVYTIAAPIRHGNLTIFPVLAAVSHDTQQFLTLDEGLRQGEVIVEESGGTGHFVRPRHPRPGGLQEEVAPNAGAQVNQLALVNHSERPLILLAGEIVTGGRQDRVIGKDRIVPADSDPIEMSVFCVEPGRWTGSSLKFDAPAAVMVQPAVRAKAMADQDQAKVWSEVKNAQAAVTSQVNGRTVTELADTTSYAGVMQNDEVKQRLNAVAAPLERDYQSLIHQLRDRNAVGVVVAVNGEIIWADIFASPSLLERYWPKLVRSYAAEAIVSSVKNHEASEKSAQQFLDNMQGRRQVAETEPGLYRHTEITGDQFKAFELTSLLPKTGFVVHVAKMAE